MYRRPGKLVQKVANPALAYVIKYVGVTPMGAHVLSVRQRRSGGVQRVPVNPLDHDGGRYLVAPRGNTHWVQNLRAAGEGELLAGRRTERFTAAEVADAEKPPILRAYLARWGAMTRSQFGVDATAAAADLVRIAPAHPVFRITAR